MAAIAPFVASAEAPLILAATEPIASLYRAVDGSASLVLQGILASPEEMTDLDLAAAAREVLDGVYAEQLSRLRDEFAARQGSGRASADLAQVARAATMGAVDTLLVDIDQTIPGRVDEETGAITVDTADDAGDYGVVDEPGASDVPGRRARARRAPC